MGELCVVTGERRQFLEPATRPQRTSWEQAFLHRLLPVVPSHLQLPKRRAMRVGKTPNVVAAHAGRSGLVRQAQRQTHWDVSEGFDLLLALVVEDEARGTQVILQLLKVSCQAGEYPIALTDRVITPAKYFECPPASAFAVLAGFFEVALNTPCCVDTVSLLTRSPRRWMRLFL